MTTIAYRNGILASESRLTEKSFIWTDNCKKIWRLKDGSLFGASGDDEGTHILLKAVRKGKTPKALLGNRGIRVYRNGRVMIFEGETWTEWKEDFVSIGSGKHYAMAAMKAGANARRAIEIAKQCDIYSGGPIQSLSIFKPER